MNKKYNYAVYNNRIIKRRANHYMSINGDIYSSKDTHDSLEDAINQLMERFKYYEQIESEYFRLKFNEKMSELETKYDFKHSIVAIPDEYYFDEHQELLTLTFKDVSMQVDFYEMSWERRCEHILNPKFENNIKIFIHDNICNKKE